MSVASLKRFYHRLAARIVAVILRPGATYLPDNFELWQRQNYHILPLHFYSPIPDTRELAASEIWSRPRELYGLDWNLECQLAHLSDYLPVFGQEFADSLAKGEYKRYGFFLDNKAYTGIDPMVLYAIFASLSAKCGFGDRFRIFVSCYSSCIDQEW